MIRKEAVFPDHSIKNLKVEVIVLTHVIFSSRQLKILGQEIFELDSFDQNLISKIHQSN